MKNLIIFDWDDTLFPTTALHAQSHLSEDNQSDDESLSQHEALQTGVREVLEEALKLAPDSTYVITNAADGWVSASAARFYPAVQPLLERLHVVSARKYFAERHPDSAKGGPGGPSDCLRWKQFTLTSLAQDEEQGWAHGVPLNVVSLGDAPTDTSAAKALQPHLPQGSVVKTVQLLPAPSVSRFVEQLRLLHGALTKVVQHPRSAFLCVGQRGGSEDAPPRPAARSHAKAVAKVHSSAMSKVHAKAVAAC